MSDIDTAPAAETDLAEPKPASITEALASTERHERPKEAGDDDAPVAPAAAAPAPPPEPTPAPTPAPAAKAAADPIDDPKSPKWFREEMKRQRTENLRLAAELQRRGETPAPQPRPAAPPAELPNPAEDPQGYHDAIARNYQRDMAMFRLEQTLIMSERFARQMHGAEKFEDCKAWLSTKPDIEAWATQQPDPWAAAFTQYTREQLAEEIGDDPNAWREKERQRLREEILAEQTGGAPAPAPQPQMRSAPPAPASTVRSAGAPRDPSGRFTGPQPLRSVFKHAG